MIFKQIDTYNGDTAVGRGSYVKIWGLMKEPCTMQIFDNLGFSEIIKEYLGRRGQNSNTIQYDSIISTLFGTVLCGGQHLEDMRLVRETLMAPWCQAPTPSRGG